MRDKEAGSWDAPVKSIWGQLSFLGLRTTPRKARGWSLGPTTFTAVLYKCCDVLNTDVRSDFLPLPIHSTLQNRCSQLHITEGNPGLRKVGLHTQCKPSNRSHSRWSRAFFTWHCGYPGPVILCGGAVLGIV